MTHLFAETESGKPQHWNCLITVIIVIGLINIGIIVLLRILLDSKDEINEYIIKDERTRDNIVAFLGFFSLSFFFGCWFCFCCGGYCCHVLFIAPIAISNFISNQSGRFINSHNPPIQRLQEEIDDIDLTELTVKINKYPKYPTHFTKTDTQQFERSIGLDRIIESEAVPEESSSNQWKGRERAKSIDVGLA